MPKQIVLRLTVSQARAILGLIGKAQAAGSEDELVQDMTSKQEERYFWDLGIIHCKIWEQADEKEIKFD